jgi:predicted ATPase
MIELPKEATPFETRKFVGREAAIQTLERALDGATAGILVHGRSHIGKTRLVRHFLHKLRDSGGLSDFGGHVAPCFWFNFDDPPSASAMCEVMGWALTRFGGQFDGDQPEHLAALAEALRENRFIIVWDKFENARGLPPEYNGRLSEADQQRLRDFLGALHGGKTKVLITSWGEEDWLPASDCERLLLGGLEADASWEYASAVLDEYGIETPRDDQALRDLLGDLDGHPGIIEMMVARLTAQSAADLRAEWLTLSSHQRANVTIITLER